MADALKLANTQDYLVVSNKIWPKQSSVGTVSDAHGPNYVYALDLWLAHADVLFEETATLKNCDRKSISQSDVFMHSEVTSETTPVSGPGVADFTPLNFDLEQHREFSLEVMSKAPGSL